jgi:hypothetical protein
MKFEISIYNFANVAPSHPTVFEYYRKSRGRPAINQGRLSGADQARFLAWIEGHGLVVAIAPGLPGVQLPMYQPV